MMGKDLKGVAAGHTSLVEGEGSRQSARLLGTGMPQVSIRSTKGDDRRLPLGSRTVIGRAEDSDICFHDRLLSRYHAEILLRQDGCYLIDMGSTNGTYLNGARVPHERPLSDGDVIRVGDSTMVFHTDAQLAEVGNEPLALGTVRSYRVTDLYGRSTRDTQDVSELVKQNRVLGVLSQATSALLVHVPLAQLFEKILELMLDAIPAERGAVILLEGDTPVIKASRARADIPPISSVSRSIIDRVVDGKVALLLPDVLEDAALRKRDSIVACAIRSAICVPLWVAAATGEPDRVLGVAYLDSRVRTPTFTEADLEVLTVLANVAAAKIENSRLLEESMEKRRMEADLRLAAEIQSSLWPVSSPDVPGYDVAAITRPSRTVGGDYYDFCFDGERLHIALGDVAGNGLGAAMLMIALRAAVRGNWQDGALADAVGRMNRTFHQNVPDDKYATFFVGRLEVDTGRLVYVNAGHNQPLLVRADGSFERLAHGGTVLGAFDGSRYEQASVRFDPGDTLVVFSDGVSDTWDDPDVADRKMVEVARSSAALPADHLKRAILNELEAAGCTRPSDDRTLLVLKRAATALAAA